MQGSGCGAGGWGQVGGTAYVRWAKTSYGGPAVLRGPMGGRDMGARKERLLSMVRPWRQHRWSTGAVIADVRMRGCCGALVCQPTLIRHKLHESRRRRGDVEGRGGMPWRCSFTPSVPRDPLDVTIILLV